MPTVAGSSGTPPALLPDGRAAGAPVPPPAGPAAAAPARSSQLWRSVPRSVWVRLVLLTGMVVTAALVAFSVGLPDAAQLRADVAAAGPAAPVVFVLLYAFVTLAPLPKNVLSVLAGVLFGLLEGTVIVALGALLGALAAFGLGRLLGREAVERLTGRRVARIDSLLSRHGVLAVLGVRLVPVLPFTAINYAAGLTAVRRRDYAIGTALGIVPGTLAYVSLGAYGTSLGAWPFAGAIVTLAVLTAGAAAAAHRHRHRRRATGRG